MRDGSRQTPLPSLSVGAFHLTESGALALVLVALAGLAAGFINVLAGGGSFLTLPAMIAAGLTALGANASSTVALFPAQAITAFMARKEMALPEEAGPIDVRVLAFISLVGGLFGAVLLLVTPPGLFVRIVPWLILFATGVFARGAAIGRGAARLNMPPSAIYAIQAVVAIYGGYFGGGIGILMLAALTIFGLTDLRVMNSIKIVLAMLMNVAAVAVFVLAGLVQWRPALVLCTASVVGALVGMAAAKRVPASYVRGFVIVVGIALSTGFLVKAWLG